MTPNIKRTVTSQDETLSTHGGARRSTWLLPQEGRSVLEVQWVKNAADWKDVPVEKNYLIPPYHWHWYQEEYFDVKKGRFIFTLEGKEKVYDSTSPTIVIPATARHTFRADSSYEGECEVHISAAPSRGIDEMFFRNLYSYLDDCDKQKVEPSVPQLLLFLDTAEVSPAFAGPAPIMRLLSWGLGVVVGRWYGGWWLGLKGNYAEYFDEKMVRTN